jgi:hypothetical protein
MALKITGQSDLFPPKYGMSAENRLHMVAQSNDRANCRTNNREKLFCGGIRSSRSLEGHAILAGGMAWIPRRATDGIAPETHRIDHQGILVIAVVIAARRRSAIDAHHAPVQRLE